MRYRPFRDPIFWIGVALYFLNKFWMQSYFDSPFFKGYVTDLLAIPIGLPFIIGLLQTVKLRDDSTPRSLEVLALVTAASVLFEGIMPHTTIFGPYGKGDIFDVMAYAVGGLGGIIWWKLRYKHPTDEPEA